MRMAHGWGCHRQRSWGRSRAKTPSSWCSWAGEPLLQRCSHCTQGCHAHAQPAATGQCAKQGSPWISQGWSVLGRCLQRIRLSCIYTGANHCYKIKQGPAAAPSSLLLENAGLSMLMQGHSWQHPADGRHDYHNLLTPGDCDAGPSMPQTRARSPIRQAGCCQQSLPACCLLAGPSTSCCRAETQSRVRTSSWACWMHRRAFS